jgi:hypothetical protein
VLAVIGALPYLNTLDAGFTAGDDALVTLNPVLPPTASLTAPFVGPSSAGAFYRPVTMLTYLVNHRLGGGAVAFHATNVGLFVCTTVAVFLLADRLSRSRGIAIATALVWAVHPIHAEGVASVSGRAEILGALGLFTSLLLLGYGLASAGRARRALLGASLVAFVGALGSNESAAAGGVLVPLVVWLDGGRRRAVRALVVSAPYWVVLFAFVATRSLVVGATAGAAPPVALGSAGRVATAVVVLWQSVSVLAVPFGLSADSVGRLPVIGSPSDPRLVIAVIGLMGVVLIAWACRRYAPLVTFGIVFAATAFAATATVAVQSGSLRPDPLLFVSSFGWCLVCGWTLVTWIGRPADRGRMAAAGVLLALLALGTWTRNVDWRDDDALLAITAQASSPRD